MDLGPNDLLFLALGVILVEGAALTLLTYLVLTGREARAKVREVFWIHENGILLGRCGRASMEGFDLDIFTSMLTAVVDFIRDSFHDIDPSMVQKIEFGRMRLYMERGRRSYLVAIYEGDYVKPMKDDLRETITRLEQLYDPLLETKAIDLTTSDEWRPHLEGLIARGDGRYHMS